MDPKDLKTKYDDLVESMKGMEVGSTEYKNAQKELQKLKDGLSDVSAAQAAFGGVNIKVYEDMIKYNAKIAAHPALTNAIVGATQALVGLSNTTRISQGEYDQFEKSAAMSYKQLIKSGFTQKESLQQMAPMLSRLRFLHEQYGYTLDAETQRLLKLADVNGISTAQTMTQEEANNRMVTAVEKLVTLMGGDLVTAAVTAGGALTKMTDGGITGIDRLSTAIGKELPKAYDKMVAAAVKAFDRGGRAADDMSKHIDGALRDRTVHVTIEETIKGGIVSRKKPPVLQAATGLYSPRLPSDLLVQLHKGERVEVTPAAQNNGSGNQGGSVTYMTFNVQGANDPYTAADNLNIAIEGNIHGVKSKLQALRSN
jgi:hypothetical protein